jgi:hypothetical protein
MKKLFVSIKNGQIDPEKSDSLAYAIQTSKDGLYKLSLSKVGTRSNPQNNYYWGVVLQLIAEHTGINKTSLHEYFKEVFLYDDGSTTEQNKGSFSEYVESIRTYAQLEWNISIPDPVN